MYNIRRTVVFVVRVKVWVRRVRVGVDLGGVGRADVPVPPRKGGRPGPLPDGEIVEMPLHQEGEGGGEDGDVHLVVPSSGRGSEGHGQVGSNNGVILCIVEWSPHYQSEVTCSIKEKKGEPAAISQG